MSSKKEEVDVVLANIVVGPQGCQEYVHQGVCERQVSSSKGAILKSSCCHGNLRAPPQCHPPQVWCFPIHGMAKRQVPRWSLDSSSWSWKGYCWWRDIRYPQNVTWISWILVLKIQWWALEKVSPFKVANVRVAMLNFTVVTSSVEDDSFSPDFGFKWTTTTFERSYPPGN